MMEHKPKQLHSIRGTRYSIQLVNKVKGMPGFAPDYHYIEIGDVVVRYDAEKESVPYFQQHEVSGCLSKEDLEEIISLMDRGFVESDFTEDTQATSGER